MKPSPSRLVPPALSACLLCLHGSGHAQTSDASPAAPPPANADGPLDEAPTKTEPEAADAEPEAAEDAEPEAEPAPELEPTAEPEVGPAAEPELELKPAPSTPPSLHPRHEPVEWYPTSGQLGITVGVPFYDESIINADMTVDIRYGRKIGWFVPYFSGGFRQARLDPKLVPAHARRKKLEAWHMTLGVRVEVPVSRQFLPFAGVAGELAHWGFEASTAAFCGEPWYPNAWRCYERYQWKAGTALKGQVGVLYKPYPDLALEFWVEQGRIVAPEMFTRAVTFIHPAVGVAWHH